jgi:hypothetical protein
VTYSASFTEIAKMILKDNGADAKIKLIYIKDGKVHVETE